MKNKICILCKMEKTVLEFYKLSANRNGLQGSCKKCWDARSLLNKRKNYDPVKQLEWSLKRKQEGRQMRDFLRQVVKFPEKYKARYTLKDAVKSGKVKKEPCVVCGNVKSQGHHDDYSKPLQVKWLCQIHHADLHFNFRRYASLDTPLTDKDI